jgi:hypothetical protein
MKSTGALITKLLKHPPKNPASTSRHNTYFVQELVVDITSPVQKNLIGQGSGRRISKGGKTDPVCQ